jgi:hypothetical protein
MKGGNGEGELGSDIVSKRLKSGDDGKYPLQLSPFLKKLPKS